MVLLGMGALCGAARDGSTVWCCKGWEHCVVLLGMGALCGAARDGSTVWCC